MNKPENKYYIYCHTDLTTCIPFYIGVGTKLNKKFRTHKSEFYRAYCKRNRNCDWKSIVNDIINYKIDILLESNDYDFILEKEKEYIKLIGRLDKNEGSLVNWTTGGQGKTGFKNKLSSNQKRSITMKEGYKLGIKKSPFLNKKVYQYSISGEFISEFSSVKEAAIQLGINRASISMVAIGKHKRCSGYKWSYIKLN